MVLRCNSINSLSVLDTSKSLDNLKSVSCPITAISYIVIVEEIRPEPNFNGVELLTVTYHLLRLVRLGVNK